MFEEPKVEDPEIVDDDGTDPNQQPPKVNMSQDCVNPNSQICDDIAQPIQPTPPV